MAFLGCRNEVLLLLIVRITLLSRWSDGVHLELCMHGKDDCTAAATETARQNKT
jgi:hypothetical protein